MPGGSESRGFHMEKRLGDVHDVGVVQNKGSRVSLQQCEYDGGLNQGLNGLKLHILVRKREVAVGR